MATTEPEWQQPRRRGSKRQPRTGKAESDTTPLAPRAAELALHLAFCERLMPAADARGKVAYCLTTAQAALAALKLEEGDEKDEQCCVA